jgi:hypothetical protein
MTEFTKSHRVGLGSFAAAILGEISPRLLGLSRGYSGSAAIFLLWIDERVYFFERNQ